MSGDDHKLKSGIRESAQGFVGRWVKVDNTQSHKLRIRFDIGCGKPDENAGKLVTWRHCVAYSEIAEKLVNIKTGDFVKVSGWVSTERISRPDGPLEKKEYLILFSGELINRDDVNDYQLSLAAG